MAEQQHPPTVGDVEAKLAAALERVAALEAQLRQQKEETAQLKAAGRVEESTVVAGTASLVVDAEYVLQFGSGGHTCLATCM